VVVDAEDGIVHENYWGEFEPERISLIASSSKQLTAAIMLRLDDEGVLDIDQPLGEIVGDAWGPSDLADRTVAQLISNSAGMIGLSNVAYGPYVCQFFAEEEMESCGQQIWSSTEDDADLFAPDSEFEYGGGQWQLAGAVAEFASGESWAELVNRVLVEPCGLGDDFGFNNHWVTLGAASFDYPQDFDGDLSLLPETENPQTEGGAYATVPDYAELLMFHLRGGECPNGAVVSQEALDTMHADRVATVYGGDAGDPDTGYGMGWWVDRETGRISDGGAYGSVPWLDLDDGYGAYLVIERNSPTGQRLAGLIEEPIHTAMVG
ncbi:MAG: serine hydrolase, partial [Actinomycetota bacterium]